ncbi:hypothetical protein N2152v2_003742 [Parachlorella kessleri]
MLGKLRCLPPPAAALCRPISSSNWTLSCRPPAPQQLFYQPPPAVSSGCGSQAWPSSRLVTLAATQAQPASIRQEPSAYVLDVLRSADGVCFDVDSTLCDDESIDEIAAWLGVGDEVAALTARAMGGTVLFQDALGQRLGVMQVSRQQMEEYVATHPPRLSKGITELVSRLRQRDVGVFLVSGGFHQVIDPIADLLGIPRAHVFANTILYNEDGSYAGFDAQEFTSRSGGKAEAVRHIRAVHGLQRVVAVGDGATDLEARQPGGAEIFIGYGGAVFRPNIAEQADWYVTDIHEILAALG